MADQICFTKRLLTDLHQQGTRADYRDTKTPGLFASLRPGGTMTFYLYRRIDGRPARVKLGTFPQMTVEQARDAAARHNGEIAAGKNPVVERRASRADAATIQDLFDLWLAHAKLRNKTWKEAQNNYNFHFGPLKNKRLVDIDTATVAKWHTAIGESRGLYIANRSRALLSVIYGEAHELGYNGSNPCAHVKRFREQSRERFLLPDEMRPFFAALKAEPSPWCEFWLLALFTGARRGNVASMAWKDIDLEQGIWYLPGVQSKNGLPLAIVLPPPAVQILKVRHDERNGSGFVFPAVSEAGHIRDPRKSWARVCKAAGIANLRPHDLRRSLGSWQAIAGSSLQIIGASLGHTDHKSTQVYSRLLMDPVRASVNGAVQAMLTAGELLKAPEEAEEKRKKSKKRNVK